MKNYAVVQHNYSEFLGLIEHQLEVRDIGFHYFRPFVGQDVPGTALHHDALFILGGNWPVTDTAHCPWVDTEVRLLGVFQKARRPVVGFGFGGLLVAQQAGAKMTDEPLHTAYWTTAHITDIGKGDQVAEVMNGRRVLVMYNGAAELSEDIKPILVDEEGNWIAIRPNETSYGFLFRPELKPGMIEDMIMEAKRETPDNIGELLQTARDEWEDSQVTTNQFIVGLVKELDLMTERKKAPIFQLNVESE